MQRLREVNGDSEKTEESPYIVNGQHVTEQEFSNLKADKSKKLVETEPNNYKVLERLRG